LSPISAAPRAIWPYALLSFAYFAGMGLFNPYAPLWLESLGWGPLAIGALASLQSWTRVIAPYAWAWLGDHTGRRTDLIRLGAVLCCFAAWALTWQHGHVVGVLVCAAVLFLANSAVGPLYEAALSQALTTERGLDTARYGRARLWGSVGFIAAVAGFGSLLQWRGVADFPWWVLAMSVGLFLASGCLPGGREAHPAGEAAPAIGPLLRQPRVRWFFATVAMTVLAHSVLYAFFSLYLSSLGLGSQIVGLLWALGVLAEVIFFATQGRFMSRRSPMWWLQLAAWVTAIRFALMGAAPWALWLLVPLQILHAFTFGAHHAASVAMVSSLFPGRLRSRGQALYSVLGYGLPGVLGGLGAGWLIEHGGYLSAFTAACICGLLGAVCARRLARHP
jgi:MFS transporter, PPP family, 3-phenylpropionic acid transporter